MEKSKKLIIFTDSGDTILDESTQQYMKEKPGIVSQADFIENAGEVLEELHQAGYTIALVADGEEESFQNVYRLNGLRHCFDAWVVSETVGVQKPERLMFQTAMEALGLKDEDKERIVMIGNNLKKDVAGANRFGIASIWLDWSPRYFHSFEEEDWIPDYTVAHPSELPKLLAELEGKLEKGKSIGTRENGCEEKEGERMDIHGKELRTKVDEKLKKLLDAFSPILYEDDEPFLQNMREKKHISEEELKKYAHWEWTQGVGLYGLWKLFASTNEQAYLDMLTRFYDNQLKIGFPELNVNTMAPYLTMSYLGEYLNSEVYMEPCRQAAEWIMKDMKRTKEGGIQHQTSDDLNDEELWDDTLFMTVLFLANMGRILDREDYRQEAQYQFLLHLKYLQDPVTGFWYHGWTFLEKNNFAGAFWGRGNCWITIAIPEILDMIEMPVPIRRILREALVNQVDGLVAVQAENGMWHTLLDDPASYTEASATCGFAYGIWKGVHTGLLDAGYIPAADRALEAILDLISGEGVLGQVSYGTPMGRTSKDFYKEIPLKQMPYGQALAILLLVEWRKNG